MVEIGSAFFTVTADTSAVQSEITSTASTLESDLTEAGEEGGRGIISGLEGAASFVRENFVAIGTAVAGAAVGTEAFARAQQDANVDLARIGTTTGLQEDALRDLVSETANVTFGTEDVIGVMSSLSRQGIDTEGELQDVANVWDLVADATGENVVELAEAGVGLQGIGIDAADAHEALDAFGFISTQTTQDVGEFLQFVERTGPELREMGLDVDDTAAFLGAMEDQLGLTGRVARQEFRTAVNESDGDMDALIETLGLAPGSFEEMRAQVDGSSAALEANAGAVAGSFTPMQRMQDFASRLGFSMGGLADVAGNVAAGLGTVGPALLGAAQIMPAMSGAISGVTKAFNFLRIAVLTNPVFLIGALIAGAVALIWIFREEIFAALVTAWEFVRDLTLEVWDAITGAIDTALQAVVGFLAPWVEFIMGAWTQVWDTVTGALEAAWEFMVAFVVGSIEQIQADLQAWWDALRNLWDSATGFLRAVWEGYWTFVETLALAITSAVRAAIQNFLTTVQRIWDNVTGALGRVWDSLWGTVKSVAETVIGAVQTAIGNYFDKLERLFNTGVELVISAWEVIEDIVDWLDENVIDPIDEAIGDFFEDVEDFFETGVGNVVGWWEGLTDLFDWVTGDEGPIETIKTAFGDFWDEIEGAFEAGVSMVGDIWEGLQNIVKAPVNFVIGTVYNNGIRKLWNTVAERIGFPTLPKIATLNQGGFVPGGGPDQDSVLAALTPGEFVLPRKAAQLVPDGFLEWMAGLRSSSGFQRGPTREGADLGSLQRLNDGGFVKSPEEVLDWGRRNSGPYDFGGFGPLFDCSGWMAALSNYAVTGHFKKGGRWNTAQAVGKDRLGRFERGKSDPSDGFVIGVARGVGGRSDGHTRGTLAGVNVESGGGGGSRVGGSASGFPYGNHNFHLPGFGVASGLVPIFREIMDLLSGVGSGENAVADMIRQAAVSVAREGVGSLIELIPGGGVIRRILGLDSGGVLAPGWNLAYNGTGAPEHLVRADRAGAIVNVEINVARMDSDMDVRRVADEAADRMVRRLATVRAGR